MRSARKNAAIVEVVRRDRLSPAGANEGFGGDGRGGGAGCCNHTERATILVGVVGLGTICLGRQKFLMQVLSGLLHT